MKIPIGLQPFTLREEMEKDYLGTLEKVAEIGYQGVEVSKTEKFSAAQLKKHLDRLRLKAISLHTSKEELMNNVDELIDYTLQLESSFIVLSWSKCDSRSAITEDALLFNKVGEQCKQQGIQFCYHNHDHEFKTFDGEYALDILLNETDPQFVQLELDTYWITYGGADLNQYLQKYKGRCPLLHLKDMEANESRFFAEVGSGVINFHEVAAIAENIGTQWFIVEQDRCRRAPLESVAISFENLKKMNLV